MNVFQIDFADRRQVQDFIMLPFRIYRDIPQWVPPLQTDERLRLDLKRYPFYKHSNAALFLANKKRRDIGRLAILDLVLYNEHNNEHTALSKPYRGTGI
jgi:hypothetical protein